MSRLQTIQDVEIERLKARITELLMGNDGLVCGALRADMFPSLDPTWGEAPLPIPRPWHALGAFAPILSHGALS